MNDIICLHKPQWNLVGVEWHMIVGNRLAAKVVPNFCCFFPQYKWLTLVEYKEFDDHGLDAVDFGDLVSAKFALEMWWRFLCRGEQYIPELHFKQCLEEWLNKIG